MGACKWDLGETTQDTHHIILFSVGKILPVSKRSIPPRDVPFAGWPTWERSSPPNRARAAGKRGQLCTRQSSKWKTSGTMTK